MANEKKSMSTAARLALRSQEKLSLKYYPDQANDCTYGFGTFVHFGPCTTQELQQKPTQEQINKVFSAKVLDAEKTVRRYVVKPELNQQQFDALVSFVYNVGGQGSRPVLVTANNGDFRKLSNQMMEYVYIHPYKNGRRMAAERSLGLINRRRKEIRPFETGAN